MRAPWTVPNYMGQAAQGGGMLQALPGANQQRSYADLQADMAAYQDQQAMADQLLQAGYVPNSGAIGAIAQAFSGYMGGKMKKEGREKLSDLLREQDEYLTKAERKKLEDAAAAEQRKIDALAKVGFSPEQAQAMVIAGVKASDVRPKETSPPAEVAAFQAYQQMPPDQRAAFDQYREKGRGPGTSVNVSLPPQIGAFQKALGSKDAELYSSARDKATAASQALNSVDALESVLSNAQTGKPQQLMGQLAQWVGAEEGATYQASEALVNDRVFELISALKGPATDKDAERAMAQIPNMGTDPRARAVVFDYIRKKAGADIQFFDEMDAYATEKGGLQGFKPRVGQFSVDTRPLGGTAGTGGMGEATDAPPVPNARKAPDGFWYVRQGNGWAKVE